MRIFAAGLATETNSFAIMRTGLEDFQIQRGRDVLQGTAEYPALDLTHPWGEMAAARGDDFVFSLMAWADPSGPVQPLGYECLRDEILTDLEASLPVDIVLLNLHGAMLADVYDSCEHDLLARVRQLVGQDTVIAAEFDLHCHLHEDLLASLDIAVTYKEYPHTDIQDRAREVFDLAVAARAGRINPAMALFDCRMVGQFPTSREPLRSFVDRMSRLEREPGILSVSFAHGFRFGDVPHMGAKILVVADGDPDLARVVAEELGREVVAMRREISFSSLALPLEEALSRAAAAPRGPVIVADQADNPGSGGPGDSTFALEWLLRHGIPDAAFGILYDPEVVRIARKAGVGVELPLRIGGKLGPTSGRPVDSDAMVTAIKTDYHLRLPQQAGGALDYEAGTVVALRCGGVDLVVNDRQVQCYGPAVFSDLGIDPLTRQLIVVKSAQHFHGAFAPLAAEIIYMSSPGAVPSDPRLIPYRRFDGRGRFPWLDDPFGPANADQC